MRRLKKPRPNEIVVVHRTQPCPVIGKLEALDEDSESVGKAGRGELRLCDDMVIRGKATIIADRKTVIVAMRVTVEDWSRISLLPEPVPIAEGRAAILDIDYKVDQVL